MFNLTKEQASRMKRLLANEDFMMYQMLLRQNLERVENSLQSRDKDIAIMVEHRNTIKDIIEAPDKSVEAIIKRDQVSAAASL